MLLCKPLAQNCPDKELFLSVNDSRGKPPFNIVKGFVTSNFKLFGECLICSCIKNFNHCSELQGDFTDSGILEKQMRKLGPPWSSTEMSSKVKMGR